MYFLHQHKVADIHRAIAALNRIDINPILLVLRQHLQSRQVSDQALQISDIRFTVTVQVAVVIPIDRDRDRG